jgi:uncharacterized repeat protein (TIGR01451 family)
MTKSIIGKSTLFRWATIAVVATLLAMLSVFGISIGAGLPGLPGLQTAEAQPGCPTGLPSGTNVACAGNPALPDVCGLKFALVFDMSASISDSQLVQMKNAAHSVVTALTGTPSEVGIYTFGTWAPAYAAANSGAPAANGPLGATSVLSQGNATTGAGLVQTRINGLTFTGLPTAARYTNWQQGLLLATPANNGGTTYNGVLFITDGVPTAYGGPLSQTGLQGPTSTTVNTSSTPTAVTPRASDVNAGIAAANRLKGQGTKVIAVGVVPATEVTLKAISGETQNSDWFLTSFAGLGESLRMAATASCQGKLTVYKEIQNIHGVRSPGAGWTFSARTSPGSVTPTSGLTGPDGSLVFNVDFDGAPSSTVTISETQMAGYQLLPQMVGNVLVNAVCTENGAPVSSFSNGPGPPGDLFSVTLAPDAVYSCYVVNKQQAASLTLVKKVTNIDGGNGDPSEWTLAASGPTPISGASGEDTVTGAPVLPGTYHLSESGGPTPPPSYTPSTWACTVNGVTQPAGTTVTLAANQAGVCTITNTEVPVVRLSQNKEVDLATAETGDTLTYDMTVENIGTGDAGAFTATDTLPTGTDFVSAVPSVGTVAAPAPGTDDGTVTWSIPALAVGDTATLTITVTVTVAPAAGTSTTLTNMFLVTPPPGSEPTEVENACPAPDADQSCADTVVEGPVPSPELTISKTVDESTAAAGDTLTYTVEVSNTGNTAEGFTVTDTLPPDVAFASVGVPSLGTVTSHPGVGAANGTVVWTVASLAVGASATLTITVTVLASAEATTQINKATLAPTTPTVPVVVDPDTECAPPETDTACAETVVPGVPRLVQNKTVDMATAVAGDELTYTMTIANPSPPSTADAVDVVAHDTLPPNVTFVRYSASQGTFDETTGTWTVGTVDLGTTATLTVVVTVDPAAEASTLVNMFQVEAPPGGEDITVESPCPTPDENASCADTVIPGVPRLTQNKVVNLLAAAAGDQLTYTMTIGNRAPPSTAAAADVVAHDTLPPNVTFVSATSSQGSFDAATGTWDVGTIPLNGTATLTLVVTVQPAAEGTTLVNAFVVQKPPTGPPPEVANPCVDDETASCAVTDVAGIPALTQSKTVDMSTAAVGDTLTYTITISNHGTGDASTIDVVAHDVLPPGVALVSFDTYGQGIFDSSTLTWTFPLPAGATFTLTLVVTVLPSAVDHTLTNVLIVDPPPGSGPTVVDDPCVNEPTESCATTAIHPAEIITDLGSPTGLVPAHSTAWRLAWGLGGGLVALFGAAGLAMAVRRPRGKYAKPRRRFRRALVTVASLAVVLGGFVAVTNGALSSGKVPSAGRPTARPTTVNPRLVDRQPPAGQESTLLSSQATRQSSSGPTLIIPALGLRAAIVPEGIDQTPDDAGNLAIPYASNEVGWWDGGPAPGQHGVAVMAAHRVYDWAFWQLPDLQPGDAIEVIGTNGQTTHWTVSSIQQMLKADLPSSIWRKDGPPALALVTCGGTFNYSIGHYNDNIVVWATPATD